MSYDTQEDRSKLVVGSRMSVTANISSWAVMVETYLTSQSDFFARTCFFVLVFEP